MRSQAASFSETTSTVLVKTSRAVCAPDIDCSLSRLIWISLVRLSHDLPIVLESFFLPTASDLSSSHSFLSVSSAPFAFPSSFFVMIKNCQLRHLVVFVRIRLWHVLVFVSVFITFNRFSSTFVTDSSFLLSVFFSSLRFTGSSGGGSSVIARFGDFAINRLFTTRSLVFLCASLLGLSSTSLLCLAQEASLPSIS